MKRIILFFAVCLGLSVSQTTFADNSDVARAAKRNQTTTVSTKSSTNRSVASDTKSETPQQKNARTATKATQQRVTNRTSSQQTQNLKSRTTTATPAKNVTARVSNTNTAARTTATRKPTVSTRSTTTVKSRATTKPLNIEKMENIKNADYSRCKTVYYECMDEFCANKDANLRRCACSSRIHEFDSIKKQLNKAEDKMLEFNQRLLTVSMDKKDAAAINVATEGETAFNIKDRSDSEKTLQKITKALDSSSNSKIGNEISSLSWDLNLDSAWDDVDALGGIATTSKNGLDLYNAARPICVEMAKEVCTDDELKIAQDGYKLTIQQDCNTVEKSYATLHNQVIEKVHESSALLDMSRLNIYQERNSDDTLTCKKKILEQLSNTSVCGENLYKCLDMTGEYIDPSNGKAFLSENLSNLANLLQEPTGDEKWSTLPQNEKFVNFLKSKKKFLEPAIKQCQDIADTIWKEFLDDALSQIKLAQKAKLEEVRQSCTKLVAECKTSALNDLSEFDSRALSVFSVIADKTANEMCSNIQNSCVTLMNVDDFYNSWSTGVSGISTDITYQSVIDTCTQIGRDCIIQKCNGTSGNFALCTNTTSSNRIAILKRDACWNEVLNCVRGADNLNNMNSLPIISNRINYYNSLYAPTTPYSQCDATSDPTCEDVLPPTLCDDDDIACLIAEQIWGNCETRNDSALITTDASFANTLNNNSIDAILSNKILIPNNGSTLLSWFAINTNTDAQNIIDSCSTYGCPINYERDINRTCQLLYSANNATSDCGIPTRQSQIINVTSTITNFCQTNVRDSFGNCCASGLKNNGICVSSLNLHAIYFMTTTCDTHACDGLDASTTPTYAECTTNINYYCPADASSRRIYLYCITPDSNIWINTNGEYICGNGNDGSFWLMIDQYGNYFDVDSTNNSPVAEMFYRPQNSNYDNGSCPDGTSVDITNICTYQYDSNTGWSFGTSNSCNTVTDDVPTDNEFTISYQ